MMSGTQAPYPLDASMKWTHCKHKIWPQFKIVFGIRNQHTRRTSTRSPSFMSIVRYWITMASLSFPSRLCAATRSPSSTRSFSSTTLCKCSHMIYESSNFYLIFCSKNYSISTNWSAATPASGASMMAWGICTAKPRMPHELHPKGGSVQTHYALKILPRRARIGKLRSSRTLGFWCGHFVG